MAQLQQGEFSQLAGNKSTFKKGKLKHAKAILTQGISFYQSKEKAPWNGAKKDTPMAALILGCIILKPGS